MMSRILLLLLALITGLSATQAAAGVRHPQSAEGMAAAAADRVVDAEASQHQYLTVDRKARPDGAALGPILDVPVATGDPDLPVLQRVSRADRARE
jgi:hypothetical protein